jgi:hypothetical protein
MAMKLYELSEAYDRVRDLVAQDGAWEPALLAIDDSMQNIIANTARILTERQAESRAFGDEIDRMSARKQAVDNGSARLKVVIQSGMEQLGITKVDGGTISVSLQSSPPSVEVLDESIIPSTFKRAKLDMPLSELPEGMEHLAEVSVNRRAILEALTKDGAEVQGTRVVQNQHIRIR